LISCLGIFACLVFLTAIYYLKHISKLNQIDWDVQTITAGDYTVEFLISPNAYTWFLEHIYHAKDKDAGLSTGESLKAYLVKEIEQNLTRFLLANKSDSHNHDDEHANKLTEVQVADLVFAFNNQDLINLLKIRGSHITYQRYDKMREVE
jgi:hypothetical protein